MAAAAAFTRATLARIHCQFALLIGFLIGAALRERC
jgi:hypothetical protein